MTMADKQAQMVTQMSDFMRSIPHRKICARQPSFEVNVLCSCDIGSRLAQPHQLLLKIILEVTTSDVVN